MLMNFLVWALGAFVVALYNKCIPPIDCNTNISLYRDLLSRFNPTSKSWEGMPIQLQGKFISRPHLSSSKETILKMLSPIHFQRISLKEFESSSFFDNVLVRTIKASSFIMDSVNYKYYAT